MAKVAIACDNYKLKKFEETLKEEGFTDYKVLPGITPTTKTIQVRTVMIKKLYELCLKVEEHFRKEKGKKN